MNKLYLFKLSQEIVEDVLSHLISGKFLKNYPWTDDSYYTRALYKFNLFSKSSSVYARYFYATTIDFENGNNDVREFNEIDNKIWHDNDFVSNHLQNILNTNLIETNYSYGEIGNQEMITLMKDVFKNIIIKGYKGENSKRYILQLEFLGDLNKDFRCLAIISKNKNVRSLSINDVDEMIDYTDGNVYVLTPFVFNTK